MAPASLRQSTKRHQLALPLNTYAAQPHYDDDWHAHHDKANRYDADCINIMYKV
jgi:hypothetical protein